MAKIQDIGKNPAWRLSILDRKEEFQRLQRTQEED
jgi:hypothetical protein